MNETILEEKQFSFAELNSLCRREIILEDKMIIRYLLK